MNLSEADRFWRNRYVIPILHQKDRNGVQCGVISRKDGTIPEDSYLICFKGMNNVNNRVYVLPIPGEPLPSQLVPLNSSIINNTYTFSWTTRPKEMELLWCMSMLTPVFLPFSIVLFLTPVMLPLGKAILKSRWLR